MIPAKTPGLDLKVGIMQPYFMPYIGYWQLLAMVDRFVLYDNIQYTKKGWINRNRFLKNGKDELFTIPLKKAAEYLDVKDRTVADDFNPEIVLNKLKEAYRKAPFFKMVFPLVESLVSYKSRNLFDFIFNSIRVTADYLEIHTEIIVSSTISFDATLRGQEKVIAICNCVGAKTYINPIGGQELYSQSSFAEHQMKLKFVKTRPFTYSQFDASFVPNLSIIDVMMFNSKESICMRLREYDLI